MVKKHYQMTIKIQRNCSENPKDPHRNENEYKYIRTVIHERAKTTEGLHY